MKVRFTDEAVSRLRNIQSYIAEDSPHKAVAMVQRIIARAESARAESLNDQYLRGRRVPEYEDDAVREILEDPYRIIYRVTGDEIRILTVMHNRQLLPGDLGGSS